MRNRIITNSFRTIKTYFPRFLSLLIMSMLGVFAFSGLSSTAPDMTNTLDKYLKENRVYDIKASSTMGLTQNDIDELKNIEGIKYAEGTYSKDILIKLDEYYTINVSSLPKDINKIKLIKGKLPTNNNEIVVEENLLIQNDLKIGDEIELNDEVFDNKIFKIVGTVDSSLYYNSAKTNQTRGNTNVGTGIINYYSYVLDSNFNIDYYTNIYLNLDIKYKTSTKEYLDIVDKYKLKLDKIKYKREKSRYDEIYNEALNKIKIEEDEANSKLNSAKEKLDNSKVILDNNKNYLDNSKSQLDEFKEKLDNTNVELNQYEIELKNAENKLNNSKKELEIAKEELDKKSVELKLAEQNLEDFKIKLDASKLELDESLEIYNYTLDNLNINEEEIETQISILTESINNVKIYISNLEIDSEEYQAYNNKLFDLECNLENLEKLNDMKDVLEESQIQYQNNLDLYNNLLTEYKNNKELLDYSITEYEQNVSKYELSELEYNKNLNEFNNNYNLYYSNIEKYNELNKEYESGLNAYYNGLNEYYDSLNKYNCEKERVEYEFKNAYSKLEDIKMPKWYIYDRTDYSTYTEYIDDTNSIKNLSKIFPVLFFSVAILISLISMNRMVSIDRNEIGTLKSLGFSNIHILNKYLLFSFLATLFGVIIGGYTGVIIIPKMIYSIYKVLFDLPDLIIGLNLNYTIIGGIIAFICICGTTIYTVNKELKEKPSELIRPKSPKDGKRIIFEKFKLWDNVSFSKKIIIRNIFRYKKRVLVTLFGIAGCTALIVCGFGIKDSIVDIANTQYGKIFKYDAIAYTSDSVDELNNDCIKDTVKIQNIKAKVNNIEVNMFISENNEELSKIVNLYSDDGKKVNLEKNKVLITEKFSKLAKLKKGDIVKIIDTDNNYYEYVISDIVENHLNHYIFMDKETYESSNKNYNYNLIYINTNKLSNRQQDKLTQYLLNQKNIINVIYVSDLINSVLNMLESLDQVVLILIVLASLLSFVVLYNLSNININERKREIATLKVLGFYNKEVDNYITKENILISIFGILIGLILGYFLTNIVISTVEIEKARFIRGISLNSYIYSSILALSFTIIVNIVTHFTLKNIDMIDSLKSVE